MEHQFRPQIVGQAVGQGGFAGGEGGGVDRQRGALVEDQKEFVLIPDVQRHGDGRNRRGGLVIPQVHRQSVPGGHHGGGEGGGAVEEDAVLAALDVVEQRGGQAES